MRLVALVALRSASSSRSQPFGQGDWWPLQIQGPGRQYVHDLHSMDIFTFLCRICQQLIKSTMWEALRLT